MQGLRPPPTPERCGECGDLISLNEPKPLIG
jgi:hypothetical protein